MLICGLVFCFIFCRMIYFFVLLYIFFGSIAKEIKGGPYNPYCGFRFDANLIGVAIKAKGGMDEAIYSFVTT